MFKSSWILGAEKFYTTANNSTRKETPEKARELDNKVRKCWERHNNFCLIKNESTNFQDKLDACIKIIDPMLK